MPVAKGRSSLNIFTPVLVGGVYGAGFQIGEPVELPFFVEESSGTGAIISVLGVDDDSNLAGISLRFFNKSPILISSDFSVFDMSSANMIDSYLGKVDFVAADWIANVNNSEATQTQIGLLVKAEKNAKPDQTSSLDRSIWVVAQNTSLLPVTYSAGSPLTFKIGVFED